MGTSGTSVIILEVGPKKIEQRLVLKLVNSFHNVILMNRYSSRVFRKKDSLSCCYRIFCSKKSILAAIVQWELLF